MTKLREIKIDPRQYVVVQYQNGSINTKLDTIWKWEERKGVPNQKFSFIDLNGVIKISFLTRGLIANEDFEGTLSLEAEISGINGTRKIEVTPYSNIGVKRDPIGVKSEPPTIIAQKLLHLFQELQDAKNFYLTIKDSVITSPFIDDIKRFDQNVVEIRKQIAALKAGADYSDILQMLKFLNKRSVPDFNFTMDDYYSKINSIADLSTSVDNIENDYHDDYELKMKNYRNFHQKAVKYMTAKVDIVLDYFNSFESAGNDAEKAFLVIVNKDLINYSVLKHNLESFQQKLGKIDISSMDNKKFQLDSLLLRNHDLIQETLESLDKFSNTTGSKFEKIIFDLAQSQPSMIPIQNKDPEQQRINIYRFINQNEDSLAVKLSIQAARIIYKKLIYGAIDLAAAGTKDGEVLNLYVNWIQNSQRDSADNSPRLPIGRYTLKETGWHTEISDMFSSLKESMNQVYRRPQLSHLRILKVQAALF